MKGKKKGSGCEGRDKTGDDGKVEIRQKKVVRRRWKGKKAREKEKKNRTGSGS